ncbi:unnamed protein product [Psylliodes chrysocephalus]|uniref:Transposase n=1 Tax=Psylliodes chrysocephalus TaxID=3402493 RepID=A0A9P0DD27_9CUCU|nr:unnamed protein product [Psylliodes chrysocephala]
MEKVVTEYRQLYGRDITLKTLMKKVGNMKKKLKKKTNKNKTGNKRITQSWETIMMEAMNADVNPTVAPNFQYNQRQKLANESQQQLKKEPSHMKPRKPENYLTGNFSAVRTAQGVWFNIDNKKHSTEEDSESEEKEDEVVFNPIILSDPESTLDSSNFTQERYLPQHIRCALHTINLIATTHYKNSVNGLLPLRQNTQIFSKCSKLWNKCGRPKSAEIIQEELGHKLKVLGITRWNSTYDAVVQIVSVKDKLEVLCDKLMIPVFKEHEISFLEEYIKLMQPLAETLDFLQGEHNTYYGYLLPSLVLMKTKLQKLKILGDIKQLSVPL